MKIAILSEAFTFAPILDELKQSGEVVVYEDTITEEEMAARCDGIDIVLLNCWVSPLTHSVLDRLTSVKLLITNTTGYDQIDVGYARSKGIAVANVPGFGTESVAELAIGLLLAVNRMIPLADSMMKKNSFWVDPQNDAMKIFKGQNLRGQVMGIVGLGAIGTRISEMADALGMHVIGYNRSAKDIPNVENRSLDDVFKESDVVSINVASTAETVQLVNEARLSLMKPTAILINTARDNHIDIEALYRVLNEKRIRGAGLDGIGLSEADHPILKLDNIVLTPHIGWYTEDLN